MPVCAFIAFYSFQSLELKKIHLKTMFENNFNFDVSFISPFVIAKFFIIYANLNPFAHFFLLQVQKNV